MQLKRLDILGFKSFANKTRINFATGVTAIVGPNGCGKTNVLDSLRWVLGEQKVSLLRGGKMEEVIFNGSRDMKPLGMSEVTLTVVNDRGVLPTEYTELQITRRLFRSGESEYLLNKVPCRLKDITDLFLDTGMGAHSYSVIQQDMVEAILSNKAEERRFLFEEAAGITKYKQRKKAALRKLEATETDFLRLKDIHAEVKTQVNSLYRQHKKAERYQRVVDDVRQWEIFLGATRLQKLENDRREFKASLDDLTGKKHQEDTQLNQLSAELEARRKEQIDLEHQLSDVSNEVYEVTESAHRIERDISVTREKRSNATALIQKNEYDIVSLKERSEQLTGQAEQSRLELETTRTKLEEVTGQLGEAETAQAEADRRLLDVRRAKEDENRKLIVLESRLSSGRTEESNLREQETELAGQVDAISEQINANTPRQTALIGELDGHKRQLDDLVSKRQEGVRRQAELKQLMEVLVEQGDELAEEISTLAASVEACEARRTLLEEMMLHYEGYGAGLVAVMDDRDRWPGIVGTVGDTFVPQDGLESALEVALGELATCLICRDRHSAEKIIGYLRQEQKGKIGILVPNPGSLNPAVKRPDLTGDHFLGWLDSLVTVDDELVTLKQAVLSRTAVFKSGVNFDDVLPHLPFGFSAVTSDGTMIRGNFITGGSEDSVPLFRRREKIEDQQREIASLSEQLQRAREKKNTLTARHASSRAESSSLTGVLEDLAEEIEICQKRVGELDFERRSLVTEHERLERERRALSSKLESVRNRQTSLGLDYGQLTDLKQELETSMGQVGERLGEYEQNAHAASERVSRLHVSMIETRSLTENIEHRLNHTRELNQEISNSISTKEQEITHARAEIAQCDTRLVELESALKEKFELREKLSERQRALRSVQAEIMEKANARESQLKEIRASKESVGEQVHQLEMKINTIHNEVKAVRERILEEYDVDVLTVKAERPDESIADADSQRHLQEQRERLRNFGAVNLLALEEYTTANERETFLSEQLTDLQSAKSDLQATISKINVTAKELFMETFGKVQGNFKHLFVELFTGGEADIKLAEPDEPLESAIEIIARPRGKKLLSIAQMSGGERALTAISLLFALYLVKPSPFCILDEIDAPLDDANCHRFLKMIRKFAGQTQFVTITHNKITMEAADNLYGITMEIPGVSKLVAVRFNEKGDLIDHLVEADDQQGIDSGTGLPEAIAERLTSSVRIQADEEAT